MKFLFLAFLFFILFVFIFGFSVLRMLFRGIFGTRPNPRNTSSNQQKSKQKTNKTNVSAPKKIITSDEGEYVDFVEIKD